MYDGRTIGVVVPAYNGSGHVGATSGVYSFSTAGVHTSLGGMASVTVATLGFLLLLLGTWFDVIENEGLVHDVSGSRIDRAGIGAEDRRFGVARDGGTPGDRTEADRR